MTDDEWPIEADFSEPMPKILQEKEVEWRKCVSCGNASKGTWCGFCVEEE